MPGENDLCEMGFTDEQTLLRAAVDFKQTLDPVETTSDEATRGYRFSWGHVEERRIENWVIWDFHFDQFHQHDPSTDLQGKLVRRTGATPGLRVWRAYRCSLLRHRLERRSRRGSQRVFRDDPFLPRRSGSPVDRCNPDTAILPCLIERVETHATPGLP